MLDLALESVEEPCDLVDVVRNVGVAGDPALRPYANASIAIQPVAISEIEPLSNYVLQTQLNFVIALHAKLQQWGHDIFNLEGRLIWRGATRSGIVAPPVIEVADDGRFDLVDGLHRVWVARELGREHISCVVMRGVAIPLITLRSSWADIRPYPRGTFPADDEKRAYRFRNADEVRAALGRDNTQVNERNFKYFLFRQLDHLGSSGVRAG